MNLAVKGIIANTSKIQGADFIKSATAFCGDAGVWTGVVGNSMQEGDSVIVFLQDAVLPPNDAWKFMERHKWRVRMARFKGAPSECVILPVGDIKTDNDMQFDCPPGTDFSEALGVTKYVKTMPKEMSGAAAGDFPSFIPKTDEPNFQSFHNISQVIEAQEMLGRIKYDGSSTTAWNDDDGNPHVASRNIELKEFTDDGATNVFWRTARKYNLAAIPAGCAMQFETVGPKIQGNALGLSDTEGRAFTLYNFREHRRCTDSEMVAAAEAMGMPVAHLAFRVDAGCYLDAEDLRLLAQVRYENGNHAEGVVFRSRDGSVSFKVINLLYKDAD